VSIFRYRKNLDTCFGRRATNNFSPVDRRHTCGICVIFIHLLLRGKVKSTFGSKPVRLTQSLEVVGSLQFGISGPFDSHVYALKGPRGIVLIDAGAGTHTEQLLQNLQCDLDTVAVRALILTHCHLDHSGGATSIRERTGCEVVAPQVSRRALETGDEEAIGLCAAREQGAYPPDLHLPPCSIDRGVSDRNNFESAGIKFEPIHVRGHSEDMFCYWTNFDNQNWLFSGDAVLWGGVLGVVNVPGAGMEGYRSDLWKLQGLGVEGLFPGHGLMTLKGGQRHIDRAIGLVKGGFLPPQVGQGGLVL
jgi:glyoxylase-like metal-dependent hydrolase (beta-lactamase superfamily II)